MPLFNRRPSSSAPTVVRNRCWNDPELDRLVAAIQAPAADRDGQVGTVLARLEAQRGDPEAQVLTTDATANVLAASPESIDATRRAAAGAPAGSPAAADAHALLARTLVGQAWDVRGSGRASTVGEDAFRTFHAILEEAEDVGWAALEIDPAHPSAAVTRLVSGRGLGLPEDEWWHRFEVARRAKPTLYAAHSQMLQALCKKWYGSHDLMFDLARTAAAEAPVGDPIGALLGMAHAEYMVEEGKALVPESDLALATAASDRWVAGGEAALHNPRAVEAHNLYGWLLRGDPQRRYFHLSRVGDRLSWSPWDYLNDGAQVFGNLLAKGDKK